MKILLIEDEQKTASYLEKGLMEQGFSVDVAADGEQGLAHGLENFYDLIILDVMLPKMSGWEVMEKLRREGRQTMALFLTARDTLADRVHGLELGADAYLVKPFAFTELLAQIKSLLRRSSNRIVEVIRIADLEVNLLQHKASRSGKKLDLTPKEFALLSLLARRSGEVLTRSLIADLVWNINFESETNVVDVHVARLRGKVDAPFEKKLIQTVRGRGYVLQDEGES
jgi:two-component system, OmpR family, copper resistance phosphate regulon response regulator CusR